MRTLLLLALAAPLTALAVPTTLTHQGRLLDSTGEALEGAVTLDIALYDAAASGTQVWTETVSTDADNGFFSITLGETTALDDTVLDGSELWLGITVDGTELPDRVRLNSVPYAVRANVTTDLVGGTVDATSITAAGDITAGGAITGGSLVINGTTLADESGFLGDVSWSAITGVPAELADGDADTLAGLGCSEGQVAKIDDSGAWACGDDTDTDTFGALTCSDGEVLKWAGGAFDCAADEVLDLSATVDFGGRISLGDDGADCDNSTAGSLRVNAAENNALEYCDGEAWTRVAGGAVGSNENNAGTDCKAILDSGTADGDGTYWIDPQGTGAFEAHCDMTTDGGGWTRFWWFEAGQTLAGVSDVLANDLNDCAPSDKMCLAIIPNSNPAEIHVQNDESKWATWVFNSTNTSQAMKAAFTARVETSYANGVNRQAFNPARQSSGFSETPYRCDEHNNQAGDNCDSFWYAVHNTVKSFYLDDDGGWAETAFGAGMDNGGARGVDSFEPVQRPHTYSRSLWLYYR